MINIKAKNVLLKETLSEAFYLVASDEKEVMKLIKAIEEKTESDCPFIHQIEVLSKSSSLSAGTANRYIPIETYNIKKEALENNIKKTQSWVEITYRCYCGGKETPVNNIMIHEEALSALRCAVYRIGSPKYVFILRVEKKEEVKVESITENYEDNSGDSSVCEESTDVKEST